MSSHGCVAFPCVAGNISYLFTSGTQSCTRPSLVTACMLVLVPALSDGAADHGCRMFVSANVLSIAHVKEQHLHVFPPHPVVVL